eukprot:jgi/Galph1/3474/GphlegSOOS_G2132.1
MNDSQMVTESSCKWLPNMVVKLNVGGKYFETTVDTLTKDKESMLSAMFSGKYAIQKDDQGAVFLDRDGDRFRHILNYLRSNTLHVGENIQLLGEILEEAEYFGLQSLVDKLREEVMHYHRKWEEKDTSNCSGLNNDEGIPSVFVDYFSSSQTSQGDSFPVVASQEFRLDEDF